MVIVIEGLINCVESFLFLWLAVYELPMRKSLKRCALGVCATALFLTFLNHVSTDTTVTLVIIWLARIFYTRRCFWGTPLEILLWPSVYMIILFCAERLAFNLAALTGVENLKLALVSGWERYWAVAIYLIICAGAVYAVTRMRRVRMDLPFRFQLLFLVFIFCSLICADFLSDYMLAIRQTEQEWLSQFSTVAFITLLGMVATLLLLIQGLSKLYMERNQLLLEKQKEEMARKSYEMNQHILESVSAWRHDYKNHLQTILAISQTQEQGAVTHYVESLMEDENQEMQTINSGNPVIDVVVSSKKWEAEKHGISFSHEILALGEPPLTGQALTILLGNLLDNAMEANLKVEEDRRWMELVMKTNEDNYCILVKNRFRGEVHARNGRLISTKTEKGHGIGMRQIDRVVNGADGFWMWETQEDIFCIKILIPIKGANQ